MRRGALLQLIGRLRCAQVIQAYQAGVAALKLSLKDVTLESAEKLVDQIQEVWRPLQTARSPRPRVAAQNESQFRVCMLPVPKGPLKDTWLRSLCLISWLRHCRSSDVTCPVDGGKTLWDTEVH